MKRKLKAGSTSISIPVFVQDTSSTIGAGLSGLVFNTAGLVAEYRRQGASSWSAITLAAGTLGTWSSGGIIADGALGGAYELGIPDAALAAGASWVAIRLRGAANMLAVLIEIELDAIDYQDSVRAGLSALPNAAAAATGGLPTVDASNAVKVQSGTGSNQVNLSGGNVRIASVVNGAIDSNAAPALANLDAAVSSRAIPGSAMTLTLTQALSTGQTGDTVGGALLAARADGFGKWVINGTPGQAGSTLVLYAADGTTIVRTFDLATDGTRA